MTKFKRVALVALALAGLVACDDDSTGPNQAEERFVAELRGENERPTRVTTNATGTANLTFTNDTTIRFSITLQNATGVTAAHIHLGGPEVAGGVLVGLFSAPQGAPASVTNGVLTEGTITPGSMARSPNTFGLDFGSLAALIRSGGVYVNVHSTANPAGLVRGQVRRQP